MVNPKWILFEGPDRSGKTSSNAFVYMKRGCADIIQDRGMLTCAFFDPPKQGEKYHIDMLRAWLNLPTSRLVIFMINYETQLRRSKETQHDIVPAEQFFKEIEFYNKYYEILSKEFPDKVLRVDANKEHELVINEIVEFLSKDEDKPAVDPLDGTKEFKIESI